VVVVVERMSEDVVAEVAAVALQFAVGQRFISAHELARDALRGPRCPRPYCTVFTCISYQLAQTSRESRRDASCRRYQSAAPSRCTLPQDAAA